MNTFADFRRVQREAAWPQWLREAVALQRIEGNPLSEEQLQMFEVFERRGLTSEERDAEIDRWAERKFGVKSRH